MVRRTRPYTNAGEPRVASVPQGERGARRCGGGSPRFWNSLSPLGDVCTGALEVLGRLIAESRVKATAVVEGLDVVEHAGTGLVARGVALVIDELGLQRVEEALETQTWFAALARKSWSRRSGAIGWLCLLSVVLTRNRRFVFERSPAFRINRETRLWPHASPRCSSV